MATKLLPMEQQKTNLERLAAFLADQSFDRIPRDVIDKAKTCVLDILECTYGCNPADERNLGALGSIEFRQQGCVLWGTATCAAPADAAFYNAVRASISYRNDLERASGTHAGAIVAASAIAAAEAFHKSSAEALAGIICGYEAMTRLGLILQSAQLPRAMRISALCGAFGAAAAAARTLSLNCEGIISALSFACHNASGNNQWAMDGTGEDVFQAGWSARAGYQAAVLAKAGAVGTPHSLEGPSGLLAGLDALAQAHMLTEGLGDGYRITAVEFKPIEGCLMVQTPAQAMAELGKSYSLTADSVERVEIHACRQALSQPGCDSLNVNSVVQAKMNIRYAACSALLHGSCGQTVWYPPFETDAKALMHRCILKEEPAYTERFPQRIPAKVSVMLQDGILLELEKSDFTPLSDQDVRHRFLETLSRSRTTEQGEQMVVDIEKMDELREINQLIQNWK